MRILFVRPRYDGGFGIKPISTAILSAIAKQESYETDLFDIGYIEHEFGSYHYLEDLRSVKIMKPVDYGPYKLNKPKMSLKEATLRALDPNPDIVAFSVISGQHVLAEKITKYIKNYDPSITIIWGGPHPSVSPNEAIIQGPDHICIGEGTDAFREFITSFKSCKDITKIDNIWSAVDGKIVRNKIRPLADNLDYLPYLDWSIFQWHDFLKPYDGRILMGGDYMLTWGCTNKCSYCINEHYQQTYKSCGHRYKVRRYSIDRAVKELKHLKNVYGLKMIKFCDENFLLASTTYLESFADAYNKEVKLPFTTACSPKLVTKEKIKQLRKAGCVSLSIGIESGNDDYRKNVLNRPDTVEDVKRAFKIANEAGIRTMAFNMFGLPFYNRKLYEETVQLNIDAGVECPTASFFYPFKGTKLREVAIDNGLYNGEVSHHMKMAPSLKLKNLSEKQLIEMFRAFALYVKMPKCYHKYIRRSEQQDEVGQELRLKIEEIYDAVVWQDSRIPDSKYLAILNKIMSR